MTLQERLEVFRQMLESCHDVYFWEYSQSLEPVKSSCPENLEESMDFLFRNTADGLSLAGKLDLSDTSQVPWLLSNSLGFFWLMQSEPEREGGSSLFRYVIGPFSITDLSADEISSTLLSHRVDAAGREHFRQILAHVPVISFSRSLEYARMFCCCLTGKKISTGEIRTADAQAGSSPAAGKKKRPADAHGTYQAEVNMLNMVRAGDVEGCSRMISAASSSGTMGRLTRSGDFLQQMKKASEVCTILFSRASIDGGIPPETAFSLTDRYYQEIESCSTLSDLESVTKTMQQDFVGRVHYIRTKGISRPIASCLDYISTHLEDQISMETLADVSGYTESHFIRKFRQETGMTPFEYIQDRRLLFSADLLKKTGMKVSDIALQLCFCSQSYYTESFRKKFGCSPSRYRKKVSGKE